MYLFRFAFGRWAASTIAYAAYADLGSAHHFGGAVARCVPTSRSVAAFVIKQVPSRNPLRPCLEDGLLSRSYLNIFLPRGPPLGSLTYTEAASLIHETHCGE